MTDRKVSSENAPSHHQLTTVTLTAQQFESLYLQPRSSAGTRNILVGNLGNPTPLGITAFLVALLPLSMDLMQFQEATSASAITLLGAFYGVAGIGMYIACIMEWIIGNTFPSLFFGVFGGFWISYAILLQPSFAIAASFASGDDLANSATAAAAGAASPAYNSGLALYFLSWGLLCFVLFLASLRTNVPFAGAFLTLTIALELLAAAYFHIADGKISQANRELKVAGAFCFVASLLGIWIDVSLIFASVGMPFRIPVIDLSGIGKKNREQNGQV